MEDVIPVVKLQRLGCLDVQVIACAREPQKG